MVLTWLFGIVGSLIMGFGMSKIMVDSPEKIDMIIGMVTGVIGLLICVLNYPIYSYLKSNKQWLKGIIYSFYLENLYIVSVDSSRYLHFFSFKI